MRLASPSLLLVGLALLAGCGIGVSQSGGGNPQPEPNPKPSPSPSPPDAAPPPSACAGTSTLSCTTCDGSLTSAVCVSGSWECPINPCPDPIATSCGDPVPSCPASTQCGVSYVAQCLDGTWQCLDVGGVCLDAGPDVAIDAHPVTFACGDQACDPTTTYCNVTTGGTPAPDGGTTTGFACDLLPSGCDNGPPTCACLGIIGNGCSCVEQHGDVTLTCELP